MIDKTLLVFEWGTFIFKSLFEKNFSIMNIERKGFAFVFVLVISLLGLAVKLGLSNNNIFVIIVAFSFRSLFFLLITYSIYMGRLCSPKILFGKYQTPEGLFNQFTHYSFLYGVTIFSFLISTIFSMFIMKTPVTSQETYMFFSLSFSFLWFAYHIFTDKISLPIIKKRILRYGCICSFLSLVLHYCFFLSWISSGHIFIFGVISLLIKDVKEKYDQSLCE